MSFDFRVLDATELEEVYLFEKKRLESKNFDEIEVQMLEWNSPWRKESLTHYIKTGWCFAARTSDQLKGYFLAQPILFFRGHTQTLWIEHIGFSEESALKALIEIAQKYGKDKHLQAVNFKLDPENRNFVTQLKGQLIGDDIYEVRTTKKP